ncbi:MAG: hypothetical protein P8Z36_11095 [Gemmatimonadota bacterium]
MNSSATPAAITPSRLNGIASQTLTMLWAGTANAGVLPRKWRETTVADTEARTMALNWETAKSPSTISTPNSAPASGALNVAAMPAPAPAAASVRSCVLETCRR